MTLKEVVPKSNGGMMKYGIIALMVIGFVFGRATANKELPETVWKMGMFLRNNNYISGDELHNTYDGMQRVLRLPSHAPSFVVEAKSLLLASKPGDIIDLWQLWDKLEDIIKRFLSLIDRPSARSSTSQQERIREPRQNITQVSDTCGLIFPLAECHQFSVK